MSLRPTRINKLYGRKKKLRKSKKNIKKPFISKENKEKIKDKDIWTFFETEEEKDERKNLNKL